MSNIRRKKIKQKLKPKSQNAIVKTGPIILTIKDEPLTRRTSDSKSGPKLFYHIVSYFSAACDTKKLVKE